MPSPKPTSLENAQQEGVKFGKGMFVHTAKQMLLFDAGLEPSPNYVKAGLAGDKDVGMFTSEILDLTYFWIRSPEEKAAIDHQKKKLIQYAEAYGGGKHTPKENWLWAEFKQENKQKKGGKWEGGSL